MALKLYQRQLPRLGPLRAFLTRHRAKVNFTLVFFPQGLIILALLYAVFSLGSDMDFFFWVVPPGLAIVLTGILRQHKEDIRDEKRFRETLKRADAALLILGEHRKRLDERLVLLEKLNAGCQRMLNGLYLELIKRSTPISRN